MPEQYLSFALPDEFVESYADRRVNWGYPCGDGFSLGELTFLTKYSRRKEDGSKERWHECCRRVVEGYYSILKDHCLANRTPWNEQKAQRSAKDAYERLFEFKWTPPGRGLWMMGTEFVHADGGNSAALQNCAFISTEKLGVRNATLPFTRLMEMSMLGVGVGFDTKGADNLTIQEPNSAALPSTSPHLLPNNAKEVPDDFAMWMNAYTGDSDVLIIEDSREGWTESVRVLLEAYLVPNRGLPEFEYGAIRPKGEPIKGFGGVAAGAGPLIDLHNSLRGLFGGRAGQKITSSDIVDIQNLIGKCVVAGNVRRSAEIALGDADDKAFLDLKNWEVNPERMGANGWGHVSNNSVIAEVGGDYGHLVDRIANNGEPGLFYLDLVRQYGRLVDAPNNRDYRVVGTNPCSEQSLESYECCTLVETYPVNHQNLDDFLATEKHAFMYAKAVTLLPTHWPESNEVMQRNRRIGMSVSGIAQFAERFGWSELRRWYDDGYTEVARWDRTYSEWLGVRESIKTTSVKPSGTVSLLAGVTPGVHWPVADVYIRRMRFATNDPLLDILADAGYTLEPDVMDPVHSVVAEFPTRGPVVRTEREVTLWEKVALAALTQRYWADNQVSVTATFQPHEAGEIGAVLRAFEGQLKSISFLPLMETGGAYKQMPYERISDEEYEAQTASLGLVDWDRLYDGAANDALGEKFCSNDTCEV